MQILLCKSRKEVTDSDIKKSEWVGTVFLVSHLQGWLTFGQIL